MISRCREMMKRRRPPLALQGYDADNSRARCGLCAQLNPAYRLSCKFQHENKIRNASVRSSAVHGIGGLLRLM